MLVPIDDILSLQIQLEFLRLSCHCRQVLSSQFIRTVSPGKAHGGRHYVPNLTAIEVDLGAIAFDPISDTVPAFVLFHQPFLSKLFQEREEYLLPLIPR